MSQNQADLTYILGLRSDVGKQRTNNEDAASVFDVTGAQAAFVVCDGMGGLRAGDIAAQEAVRTVQTCVTEMFQQGVSEPLKALAEAFRRANDAVNALTPVEVPAPPPLRSEDDDSDDGRSAKPERRVLMGTTCIAGVVRDSILYLGHAGDSRAYRWRRGHMTRLTEDHSFVAERVRAGDMTEAEARTSRFRNIVTRGIGIDATVEPEFRREPLEPGDLILVCSDGLTTMMEDPEIAAVLNRPNIRRSTPEQTAAMLVDLANRAGGLDNITVMVLKVGGDSEIPESAEIIDIDAPTARRPKAAPVLLWVLVGVLLALAIIMALFTFVSPVRQKIGQLANPSLPTVSSAPNPAPNSSQTVSPAHTAIDYRSLVYDAPQPFAPDYLARGDLLAYAQGQGLYFVAGSTGKVARLDSKGTAVLSVATLEMPDFPTEFPPSHVFLVADPQGNVYISNTQKKVVVKKGADGKLLDTISGFKRPEAIALDELGNLYVVDFNQITVCHAHLPKSRPTPSSTATPKARV